MHICGQNLNAFLKDGSSALNCIFIYMQLEIDVYLFGVILELIFSQKLSQTARECVKLTGKSLSKVHIYVEKLLHHFAPAVICIQVQCIFFYIMLIREKRAWGTLIIFNW